MVYQLFVIAEYGDGEGDTIAIALVHAHLPKLTAMDVVAWRRGTDEVHAGPRFDEIRSILQLVDAYEDRSSVTHDFTRG